MKSTGAPPPSRAGFTGNVIRLGASLRNQRAFNRDIRRARRIFHKDLGLAPGASLQKLVDAIAAYNQRPISILEKDLDPELSGCCLRGGTEDRIVVARDLPEWQRERVKAHELGHLLAPVASATDVGSVSGHGHGHSIQLDPQALAAQLATLPADLVQDVLTLREPPKLRATYDTDEERAVEAWGLVVPTLLSLDGGTSPADAITSAFGNRMSM